MAAPSYAHGASSVPLLGETIGENLRRTVVKHGDREALVVRHQGFRASYRELWDRVGLLAGDLAVLGVGVGDRATPPVRRDRPVQSEVPVGGRELGGRLEDPTRYRPLQSNRELKLRVVLQQRGRDRGQAWHVLPGHA